MQNEITAVFGRKRTRKTRWMLRELKQRNRVFYIDPKSADLGRPEYQIGVECRGPDAVRDLTERGGNFCVRIPTADDEWVDLICQQALFVSDCIVVIDEVDMFSQTHSQNEGVGDILRAGGAAGVSLMGCAHRPSDVNIRLLAAADRIIVFQTTHANCIDRLQHYITAEPEAFMDLSAPDEADPMRVSEYLEWRVSWGRKYEIKTFNEKGKDSLSVRGVQDNRSKKPTGSDEEGTEESAIVDGVPVEGAGSED